VLTPCGAAGYVEVEVGTVLFDGETFRQMQVEQHQRNLVVRIRQFDEHLLLLTGLDVERLKIPPPPATPRLLRNSRGVLENSRGVLENSRGVLRNSRGVLG